MRVGNGEDFEDALQRAVLPRPAVQHVECHIRVDGRQHRGDVAADIDAGDAIAAPHQGVGTGLAGAQGDLALGGPASHQNGDVLAHRARPRLTNCSIASRSGVASRTGRYATPIRLISHSSSTPEFSRTRLRTVSPSVSMSAALALPRLIRKLQCISDTCASPTLRPRQPARSISCQALEPGGFLKVEPPVRLLIGWVASRDSVILSISAAIAAGSPGAPWNSACVKMMSSGAPQWR